MMTWRLNLGKRMAKGGRPRKADAQIRLEGRHGDRMRDAKLPAGELMSVGAADEVASFVSEEVERLSDAISWE